jgi:hypothetical protein
MAEPPLKFGAVNATVADVLVTAVAVPIVGAPGADVYVPPVKALSTPVMSNYFL